MELMPQIPIDELVRTAEEKHGARAAEQLRFLLTKHKPRTVGEAVALLDRLMMEEDRP
jgi:hypothetical protein